MDKDIVTRIQEKHMNKHFNHLLKEAIRNECVPETFALILSDSVRLSEDTLIDMISYAQEEAHTYKLELLYALSLYVNPTNPDSTKDIFDEYLDDEELSALEKFNEKPNKLIQQSLSTPLTEQMIIIETFDLVLKMNEYLLTDIAWEQEYTEQDQLTIAQEVTAHPDFFPLQRPLTKYLRSLHLDTLEAITSHPRFLFNAKTMSTSDTHDLFNHLIQPIRRSHDNAQQTLITSNIASTKGFRAAFNELSYELQYPFLGKRTVRLTQKNYERVAKMPLTDQYINQSFKTGTIPFYKMAISESKMAIYDNQLTDAIKQQKWEFVELFINIPDVDFHKKQQNTKTPYSLLEKAAKKSNTAKVLFRQMCAIEAGTQMPRPRHLMKNNGPA